MVQALHRALPERGIGVWSFDFPAHGDSPMGQEGLRVPFCMDDLETVEAWIRAKSPQVEVCYFASSFGAYITLLSLSRAPRNRPRAFLRSAAVTMPQLVARWLTPRAKKDLERRMHTFGRCGLPLHFFGTCGNMICFPVIRRSWPPFLWSMERWMRWCP